MKRRFSWHRIRRSLPLAALSALATLHLVVAAAAADERDAPPEAATEGPATPASQEPDAEAPVALERLLRLPDSYRAPGERRRGIDRSEWQARFAEARASVAERNAELDRIQEKLSGLASSGGQWQAGAPGLANTDSQHQTLSYKLHQDLRSARTAIEDAERGLLELGVQADLAGVPQEWRE